MNLGKKRYHIWKSLGNHSVLARDKDKETVVIYDYSLFKFHDFELKRTVQFNNLYVLLTRDQFPLGQALFLRARFHFHVLQS